MNIRSIFEARTEVKGPNTIERKRPPTEAACLEGHSLDAIAAIASKDFNGDPVVDRGKPPDQLHLGMTARTFSGARLIRIGIVVGHVADYGRQKWANCECGHPQEYGVSEARDAAKQVIAGVLKNAKPANGRSHLSRCATVRRQ